MSTPIVRAALLLAALLMLARCAAPQAAPPATSQAFSLEGTSWTLVDLAGRPLVAGEAPTARFEGGQVHGSDGCNRYAAPVTTKGSSIAIGPQGPSTMMACPEAVMRQAEAYMTALFAARSFRVVGDRLTLIDAGSAVVASFAAQSQSLAGTSWNVVGINNGRQAVVGVHVEGSVTMTFGRDGTVSGQSGCNRYSATYRRDGTSLHFTPPASTRLMCADDEIMKQEQAFLAAMQTVSTISFDGPRLDLRTADGAMAILLTPAPSITPQKPGS